MLVADARRGRLVRAVAKPTVGLTSTGRAVATQAMRLPPKPNQA